MKQKEQGFSLLEAVFAILLFALATEMLMNFFVQTTQSAMYHQKKTLLMDNARNVNSFIQEQIRSAVKVQIVLEDGTKIDPFEEDKGHVQTGVSGKLKSITLQDATDHKTQIVLEDNPNAGNKEGSKILKYQSDGTSKPVSDMIDEIKVSRQAGSEDIIFDCSYKPLTPRDPEREHLEDTFTQSLMYKKKVS